MTVTKQQLAGARPAPPAADDYVTVAVSDLSRAEGEVLFTQFSSRLARSADHRDLLYQAPTFNFTELPLAEIAWPPLGRKPSKEHFGVLHPIANYPVKHHHHEHHHSHG